MTENAQGLKAGSKAPSFSLDAFGGSGATKAKLSQFKGKNLVLYFYPKDLTSGCTKQAEAFTKDYKKFQKLDTEILGVSPDSLALHEKFQAKYNIPYPLISDEDHALCEKYGVWAEKSMYGRKYWGVVRSTFLIDASGRIARVWSKVKVPGHSEEVLAAVKEL